MTKPEFIAKWRYHLAGIASYGYVSANDSPTLERSKFLFELPNMVESLLSEMYGDANPKLPIPPPPPPPGAPKRA